ncbi:hypothetical protein [Undibacterium baiyunense]|nr:hypothetical protein [Undibacterium baiyunense]
MQTFAAVNYSVGFGARIVDTGTPIKLSNKKIAPTWGDFQA